MNAAGPGRIFNYMWIRMSKTGIWGVGILKICGGKPPRAHKMHKFKKCAPPPPAVPYKHLLYFKVGLEVDDQVHL